MAGEQRGGRGGLAQQGGGGLGIGAAAGDRLPGRVQVDGDAAHAGIGQQEAQQSVLGLGHGGSVVAGARG